MHDIPLTPVMPDNLQQLPVFFAFLFYSIGSCILIGAALALLASRFTPDAPPSPSVMDLYKRIARARTLGEIWTALGETKSLTIDQQKQCHAIARQRINLLTRRQITDTGIARQTTVVVYNTATRTFEQI